MFNGPVNCERDALQSRAANPVGREQNRAIRPLSFVTRLSCSAVARRCAW